MTGPVELGCTSCGFCVLECSHQKRARGGGVIVVVRRVTFSSLVAFNA